MTGMALARTLKNTVKLLWLDRQVISEIAGDKAAALTGMALVALTGALVSVQASVVLSGTPFPESGLAYLFLRFLLPSAALIAYTVVGAAVAVFLATLFRGKGDFLSHYRCYASTYLTFSVLIIPFVGLLLFPPALLWKLHQTITVLKVTQGISYRLAAAAVLIPFLSFLLVVFLAFPAALYAMAGIFSRAVSVFD